MRIAFVQCPAYGIDAPPLGIAYLSSYLRSKGYETKVFDFNIELYNKSEKKGLWEFWRTDLWSDKKKIFENFSKKEVRGWAKRILKYNPTVVCFSIYITSVLFSIELAKKIKELDKTKVIIFGGPVCFKEFNKFLRDANIWEGMCEHANIIVSGEGEIALSNILDGFKKSGKRIIPEAMTRFVEQRALIKNLDLLPIPDYAEFKLKEYKGYQKGMLPILTSRGCPNKCVFCTDTTLWKGYRTRSAQNILKEFELRKKRGFRIIAFNDSTMNGNLTTLSELCDSLIKEKINMKWVGCARIDPKMDFAFFKKMKKAGCESLTYGAESASSKMLKQMNKQISIRDISKTIIRTRVAGIKVSTNWVVGFPSEKRADFIKTVLFIIAHRPFINELSIGRCFINPASLMELYPERFNVTYDKKRNWHAINKRNTLDTRVKRLGTLLRVCKLLGYKPTLIVKNGDYISNIVLKSG